MSLFEHSSETEKIAQLEKLTFEVSKFWHEIVPYIESVSWYFEREGNENRLIRYFNLSEAHEVEIATPSDFLVVRLIRVTGGVTFVFGEGNHVEFTIAHGMHFPLDLKGKPKVQAFIHQILQELWEIRVEEPPIDEDELYDNEC